MYTVAVFFEKLSALLLTNTLSNTLVWTQFLAKQSVASGRALGEEQICSTTVLARALKHAAWGCNTTHYR